MIRECYLSGVLLDSAEVSDERWASFLDGLEYWRREFGVLLDRGVGREEANNQIIGRMNGGEEMSRCRS